MQRVQKKYRGYLVVAGGKSVPLQAIVYLDSKKQHSAEANSLEHAQYLAERWIDAQIRQREGRRKPHIGTKDEYIRALRGVSVGEHQRLMLRAHANAPNCTLTATELAVAAGYEGYESANAHYGALARRIGEFLEMPVPKAVKRDDTVWTHVLAAPAEGAMKARAQGKHWRWRMHPELVEALRELNMA